MKTNLTCLIAKLNTSGAMKLTVELVLHLDPNEFERRVIFQYYDYRQYRRTVPQLRAAGIPFVVLYRILPEFLMGFAPARFLESNLIRFFGGPILRWNLRHFMRGYPRDVLYSNIDRGRNLKEFIQSFPRRIIHIHVNNRRIDQSQGFNAERIETLNAMTHVLAGSANTLQSLISKGVSTIRMSEMGSSIVPFEVPAETSRKLRESLGFAPNDIVIGGCGGVSERKGTDLFIQVAARLAPKHAGLRFIWISGPGSIADIYRDKERTRELEELVRNLGDRFVLTDMVPNPHDYFSILDMFVMSSRSDGLPLVLLESMSLGLPVVSGTEVAHSSALLAPCIHKVDAVTVENISAGIEYLLQHPEKRQTYGESSRQCILDHFDTRQRAKQLAAFLRPEA